jgi:hypothetical protein
MYLVTKQMFNHSGKKLYPTNRDVPMVFLIFIFPATGAVG